MNNLSKHIVTSMEDAGVINDDQVVEAAEQTLVDAVNDIAVDQAIDSTIEGKVEELANADYAFSQVQDAATMAADNDDRASFESANLAFSVLMSREGQEHDRSSFESYSTVPAAGEILRRVTAIRSNIQKSIVSLESGNQDLNRLINKINKVSTSNRAVLKTHQQTLAENPGKIAMSAYGIYDFLHMNGRLVKELSPAIRQDFKVLGEMIKISKEFDRFYSDVESQSKKAYGSNPEDVRRLLDTIRRFDVKRLFAWASGNNMLWNGSFTVQEDDFQRSGNRGGQSNDFFNESWFEWQRASIRYAVTTNDGSTAPQNIIDEAIARAEELSLQNARNNGAATGGFLGGVAGGLSGFGLAGALQKDIGFSMFTVIAALGGMFVGAKVGAKVGGDHGEKNAKPADRGMAISRANHRFRGSQTQVEFTGKDLANACSDAVDICNVLPVITRSAESAYVTHQAVVELIEKRLSSRPDAMVYADLAFTIAGAFTGKDFSKFSTTQEDVAARNEEVFGLIKDYMTSIYLSQFSLIEAIVNHLCITVAGVAAVCEKAEAVIASDPQLYQNATGNAISSNSSLWKRYQKWVKERQLKMKALGSSENMMLYSNLMMNNQMAQQAAANAHMQQLQIMQMHHGM